MKTINSIEIEKEIEWEDDEYTAYTNDATIVLICDFSFGDADGRRSIATETLDECMISLKDVCVYQDGVEVAVDENCIVYARHKLIEKMNQSEDFRKYR